MELNKENMRKIRELILFTALLIVVLWKYEEVLEVLGYVGHLIFPFLLGGAIAFVLNVPMNFIERHLFTEKVRKNKVADKLARPVSLLSVLCIVVGVLTVVIFGVVPQLVNTFGNLGQSITQFIPHAQAWGKEVFHGNKEVVELINSVQFDWDKIVETLIDFLKNGAGNMLNSTLTAAKSIISGVSTFVIAFVFAIYILLQKKKLGIQAKKVLFAFVRRGRAEAVVEVSSLTYSTFSSFLTGQCLEAVILGSMFVLAMTIFRLPVCRGCNSGDHVFYNYEYSEYAVCTAGRNLYRIYRTDTYFWSISWLCGGSIFNLHGRSDEGAYVHRVVSCAPADRREPDLSACSR